MAELTQARLREVLNYNPETGIFTWHARPWKEAGCRRHDGYRLIRVDDFLYLSHRLAWLYVYGELPPQLDHKDMVRDHNWIGNLRPATDSQNLGNRKRRPDNRSGLKGVTFMKETGRWRARLSFGGRVQYHKHFDTSEEAYAAYCEVAKEYFGDFANLG